MQTKKRSHWKILIAATAAAVAALLAVVAVFAGANGPERRYNKALELGEQHLLAGEYEQAVLQFTAAIEVLERDPSAGDRGFAVERLQTALSEGAVSVAKAEGLAAAEQWLEDVGYAGQPLPVPFVEAVSLLEEIRAACAAEDYDAVFARLADEGYKDTVAAVMDAGCNMSLIDDEGMMTAIYRMEVETQNFAGATYMVYYGQHNEGRREGQAVWLGYENRNNYVASGTWADDMPNGAFETRSWQESLDEDVVYRIISGNVVNGLWDGKVQWKFDRGTEEQVYEPSFSAGKWQILREEEDGFDVVAEGSSDVMGIPREEKDILQGIAGYAQAA